MFSFNPIIGLRRKHVRCLAYKKMKKILIIFCLYLSLFSRNIFADQEAIIINNVDTENLHVGQTFPVGFIVNGVSPDTSYDFKFFGGPPENKYYLIQTYNQVSDNFLSFDDDWSQMPSFHTDLDGNAVVKGIASITDGKNYCTDPYNYCYSINVDIADQENHQEIIGTPQDIKVSANLPEITPTIIPTPTPTITPTSAPTSPIILKITPTPVQNSNFRQIPVPTATPTINLKIFGISTTSASLKDQESTIPSISDNSSSKFIEVGSNPQVAKEKPVPIKKTISKSIVIFSLIVLSFLLLIPFFLKKNKK